ncbi:MAG TPA: DoxX family protein [Gammaproteobacteria bacterium]|nr:DoxX family protein [Gammaproteobacteria bacterium]
MNIVLWVLQILLALHTVMGAIWKFTHSAQTVPSLGAIPRGVWRGMSVVELLCSLGLILTAYAPLALLTPLAALGIGLEMLFLCTVHLRSGATKHGQMVYWLVVAALCAVVAYGRFAVTT